MTQIAINPVLTTVAAGSFNTQSQGFIQGVALDDPSIRNKLSGGILYASELLPMWGGVGISEFIPGVSGNPDSSLGSIIKRAALLTGATALTGFSVFDQNHSAINSPQSPVPLVGQRMTLNFYRLGTGARIPVAMDPALVSLDGGLITQQVSWDFGAQKLVPYVAAYAAIAITSMAWAGGIVSAVTAAHPFVVGSDFNISGALPAGYNGSHQVLTTADNTHLTFALADDPGAETTPGQIDAGGGALSVKVLETQIGNSMTVEYDPETGFATWNRSGSTAIILI